MKEKMPIQTFKCEACKGEFETNWSDEKAMEEFAQNFPEHKEHHKKEIDHSVMAILCTECYYSFLKEMAAGGSSAGNA